MEKFYVVLDNANNSKYAIIGTKGFVPTGAICEAPKDTNGDYITDPSIIRIDDIQETISSPKPALDGNGDPILDENDDPTYEVDGNGDTIMEDVPLGASYKQAVVDSTLNNDRNDVLDQEKRDRKLADMRATRNEKLLEVDLMVNDLVLEDRTDTAAVQTYRSQLRNITNTYKDSQDKSKGTAALDTLAVDLSDLTWPTKP